MIDVKHVVPLTLLAQLCVSLAVAAVLWVWVGKVEAVSALLGGAAVVVPNGFLAARLLASNRDPRDAAMMRAAWIGEIGKLLLTALLFAVIFKAVRPLAPLAVFAGFIAAQLVVFGALLIGSNVPGKEAVTKS
ncbi:MAG TPA: ATP synthase subunit I [Gammaproteobacteria bacterium]